MHLDVLDCRLGARVGETLAARRCMQRRLVLSAVVLAAVGTASCSRDPEAAKQKFLVNGDRYLAEKKYPEAIVEYRNALKQDAKFGDARLKLTDAYLATGDVRNAVGESVRAADVLPESVEAQMRAGSLLLLARQYPEAKQRAVNALERDPKNPQALILLGNSLAGLKDLDGAIQQIEQAIDQNPQLTITYTNLADLYAAKGDRDAAERAFESAVKAAPNSVDTHLGYANFLWAERRWQEAERELNAAAAIEPKSVAVNRALAAFYASQNRPAEAVTSLETYASVMGTVEARLLLADYFVGTRNVARATQVLNELAKDPRGLSAATVRLAMLDFRDGRRPEAYKRLDGLLAKDSKDQLALQGKARLLLMEGRSQEALRVTESLIAINAELPSNRYLHGLALEGTGSLEDATATYLDLLKADPSSSPLIERLATIYLRRQDPKDALGYAEQFVRAQPQSASAHLLYAQALLQSGSLQRAEEELIVLSKVAPSSPDVFTWLGMLYEGKHDTVRARQSYQRAFDLQPTSIAALSGLVSVDMSDKKPAAAISRIESQIAERPGDSNLLVLRALALMRIGDLPKAEAAYQKVIEVLPNNVDAYGRLAAIYLAQNRLDDAKARYEDILKRQPQSAAAETMLGTILARQNNAAEARRHFERAVEIEPRSVLASNNLAWDYANNGGNLDVALQLAQTAKAGVPENASVTDTLGWVYYKKGLSSLAISTFRQAAALDASNANIQYHLGLALIQQGDKVEAKRALEQAVRLNPKLSSDEDFKRVLAGLTAS
jgi:tetratricopeptide (TPR) repeat protein